MRQLQLMLGTACLPIRHLLFEDAILSRACCTAFAHGRQWVVNSCSGYAWAYRGRAVYACKRVGMCV